MLPSMAGYSSGSIPAFHGEQPGGDDKGGQAGTNFVASWLQRVLGRCKQRLGSSAGCRTACAQATWDSCLLVWKF